MSDAVTAFTTVFGEHYIDALEHASLPSLMQPGNFPAIKRGGTPLRHVMWTLAAEHDRVAEICERVMPGYEVEIRDRDPNDAHIVDLRHMLLECLEDGSRLLLAPPNVFWGNGSIANMVTYAEGRGITVAAANLRVLDTAFRAELDEWPWKIISNPELVALSMNTLHPATRQMFDNEDVNATYFGGISLRQLDGNLWAMVHHLPSPWLVSVQPEDVAYFSGPDVINFGDWDHRWPSVLLEQERLRVIGSSDLVWSAGLTPAGGHYAPLHAGLKGNDRYKARLPHNLTGGRLVMSLRGDWGC